MTIKSAGAMFLAMGLLAGCGDHKLSSSERAKINADFTRIDFEMSNYTLGQPSGDQKRLRGLTDQYVKLTRKYADDLGKAEVTRLLADKADELEPVCLACVGVLDKERATYDG